MVVSFLNEPNCLGRRRTLASEPKITKTELCDRRTSTTAFLHPADDALLSIGRIISFLPPGDFALTAAAVAAGSGAGASVPTTASGITAANPEMRSRTRDADIAAIALDARLARRATAAGNFAGLDLYLARLDRPAFLDSGRGAHHRLDRGGDLLGDDARFWREDPRWHAPGPEAEWTSALRLTEQLDRQQVTTKATRWPSSFGRQDLLLAQDESQLELAAADAFFAELANEAEN